MARKIRWKWFYSVLICIFSDFLIDYIDANILIHNRPSAEFTHHSLTDVNIKRVSRNHRSVQQTDHHITVTILLNNHRRLLDLQLNHDLIPASYFEKVQDKNGTYHVRHVDPEQVTDLCHYNGVVRDVPGSWAAVSTCNRRLRGVVYDGSGMNYIESGPVDGQVVVYHSRHRVSNNTDCDFPHADHNFNRIPRSKREVDAIRGPYNANEKSRYVELVLVVDNKEYKALGEELPTIYQHCKDIANIINSLFMPLNIFVALVGVVVWTEFDEIALSSNGDTTLTNFLHYRRERLVKEHPNDNAQLLTRTQFEGGVVGKALKGPICTYEFSGGVNMDHSSVVGLVATTVAHELGHNFGMEHDTADCNCPHDRCIMAPSSSSTSPSEWSDCSKEHLLLAFQHGMDYCLRNKPAKLFESPVCGNGFVEPGEQCDCGLPHSCTNTCCNASSCMLFANASCATGQCCDLQTCRPKTPGTMCRKADHECDLPEFCTGESEYCPSDVYKMDGEVCSPKAYCYQGACRTHADQCRLLWGPSGKSSADECYDMNTRGSRHGNCGYNRLNQSYFKCVDKNVMCGMVHCSHLNERLEFGMESVSILSHSFINNHGSIIPCRTAIVDLGLNEVDPGLAPDGAKCDEGKMCVNQKCMPVDDLRRMSHGECPRNCNNNGVCNSKGHCHCFLGFAPPYCDQPGVGGSLDSGPATNPNKRKNVATALYIIFLGIVPLIALSALFVYYTKHNVKNWWEKSTSSQNNANWEQKRKGTGGGAGGMENGSAVRTIDVTVSPSDCSNLLQQEPPGPQPVITSTISRDMFGQFKGFSITPMKKENSFNSPASSPVRIENKLDNKSVEKNNLIISSASSGVKNKIRISDNININEESRLRPVSPPTLPTVTFNTARNKQVHFGPKIQTTYVTDEIVTTVQANEPDRPKISDPVLEASTCTHKEVVETGIVPVRKAPEVPTVHKYNKVPPPVPKPRPLSSPVLDQEDDKLLRELKDNKEYPTLTKLASFMRNTTVSKSQNFDKKKVDKKEESKMKKLDKERLKSVVISDPIPQGGAGGAVARAHSMREAPVNKPTLQSFGSMRVAKRPNSIVITHRPTSPPPPRPTLQTQQTKAESRSDYSYDDCLNLLSEKMAPLANIDEESPSTSDNIYSVIEESPKEVRKDKPKTVHFEDKYEIPKPPAPVVVPPPVVHTEYKVPKPLVTGVSTGSTESMGLLGEIVTEIQARNLDSIYSTGTLKKNKKKKKEEQQGDNYENVTGAGVYNPSSDVSSSSSSSGYLNPNKINPPQPPPTASKPQVAPYKPAGKSIFDSLDKSGVTESKTDQANKPAGKFGSGKFVAIVSPLYNSKQDTNGTATKPNDPVDISTYKPYSSSFTRPSGPLASSFIKKNSGIEDKKTDGDNSVSVSLSSPLQVSQTVPSSASPVVKSSFTKPGLLGTPTPPKLTPQSITSTFKTPPAEIEPPGDKKVSKTPNIPTTGTLKRTLSGGKGVPTLQPTQIKIPTVIRPAPSAPNDKTVNRPLPTPPKKVDITNAPTKPLPPIPKKDSKENLKIVKKSPTEPVKPIVKRNSNIASLQSKFDVKPIVVKPKPVANKT